MNVADLSSGKPLLIVGGGIAGITAALRARSLGLDVVIVEKQAELGGLLSSCRPSASEHVFDHGTHIPAATCEPALDAQLFGDLDETEWQTLPVLRAGTFWNGQLSPHSPCLDLRTLPVDQYDRVRPEMLAPHAGSGKRHASLATQIDELYGTEMRRLVFEPVLRKFYGLDSDALAPNAHRLFGLLRFISAEPVLTRKLKLNPVLDAKLAFHRYDENPPGVTVPPAYYPRKGGIGRWIAGLVARLARDDVRILTETTVTSLDLLRGRTTLSTGEELEFGACVWCLPASFLLRLHQHPAATTLRPPQLASITLYHFVTDRPAITDAHYITCFDPAMRTFRVTLYDNLQPEWRGRGRVTVEVLRPRSDMPLCPPEDIFRELIAMKLIAPDTRSVEGHTLEVPAGFPIQTAEYRDNAQRAAELVMRDFPSVRLLGRASGQSFFMKDVLVEAWNGTQPLTSGTQGAGLSQPFEEPLVARA